MCHPGGTCPALLPLLAFPLILIPALIFQVQLGGSDHFFLIALSLHCCSRWMQLENRRKTKKSSSKSDKNWPNGTNLCTRFVTDFYKHGYTGSYRGLWHKKFPLYLTANLTNKEFFNVWSNELNLWTLRLVLAIAIPKRAEKFKFMIGQT